MVRAVENLRKRKATGGARRPERGRRVYEKDSYSTETLLGEPRKRARRMRGGWIKILLDSINTANVLDPSKGAIKKSPIKSVLSNAANRDYERRGMITKGAIIATELGKAKVISRPGQDGVVNAVLVK